jgi:hypothetical protein
LIPGVSVAAEASFRRETPYNTAAHRGKTHTHSGLT